jgi:hypothetical protein
MQEPGNPVAARGTPPDPILSFYYYYYHYYDKHTPLGWGSPLRAWLLIRSFHFTSEGVDRSATNKVSAPRVSFLQGGLGSPLRAMLLLSFYQRGGLSVQNSWFGVTSGRLHPSLPSPANHQRGGHPALKRIISKC